MLTHTLAFARHKPSASLGFLSSIGSLLLGIWVASLPAIKQRLHFSDGSLGLSLLLAPAGSLAAVALSSVIFSRMAVGRALLMGCSLQCLVYIAQVMAFSRPMFWGALFAAGFLGCLNGIASNATVNSIERRTGRKIMSTCHGMYSLGGGISAGLAAVCYNFGISSLFQMIIVSACILLTLVLVRHHILAYTERIHSGSSFTAPPAALGGLAFICFVTFMGEGCIADWSAIYLKESLHSTAAVASLGFAGFSTTMALGRFNGDQLVLKYAPQKLVISGSLVAALGFLLVVSSSFPLLTIAGFALIGLGYSCIVPIIFSAAANIEGLSPAMGIASIASGGLIGFLTGPAIIGFIAEKISLAGGLSFVLVLSLVAGLIAAKNKFLPGSLPPSIKQA